MRENRQLMRSVPRRSEYVRGKLPRYYETQCRLLRRGRSIRGRFRQLFLGVHFEDWRGLLGLFPVATAVLAFCPLYVLFGFDTTPTDESHA